MATPRVVLISRLILENRGQILLLAQTTKHGGKYALPGGKVEINESPTQALIRECKEEADIDLNENNLKLVHVLHRPKNGETLLVMYFKAVHWQGSLKSREPKKFKKTDWFLLNNLPKNLSRTTKSVLEKFHKGVNYSEAKHRKNATN
jgi:8-oxo-dGTP diphosphatase